MIQRRTLYLRLEILVEFFTSSNVPDLHTVDDLYIVWNTLKSVQLPSHKRTHTRTQIHSAHAHTHISSHDVVFKSPFISDSFLIWTVWLHRQTFLDDVIRWVFHNYFQSVSWIHLCFLLTSSCRSSRLLGSVVTAGVTLCSHITDACHLQHNITLNFVLLSSGLSVKSAKKNK